MRKRKKSTKKLNFWIVQVTRVVITRYDTDQGEHSTLFDYSSLFIYLVIIYVSTSSDSAISAARKHLKINTQKAINTTATIKRLTLTCGTCLRGIWEGFSVMFYFNNIAISIILCKTQHAYPSCWRIRTSQKPDRRSWCKSLEAMVLQAKSFPRGSQGENLLKMRGFLFRLQHPRTQYRELIDDNDCYTTAGTALD